MSGAAKVVDVIFCDQVRREDNGKLLFLGVYLNTVLVHSVPCSIPSFTFAVKWKSGGVAIPAGRYAILDPEGRECVSVDVESIPFSKRESRPKDSVALGLHQLSPFVFPAVGTYQLVFRKASAEAQTLATFDVGLVEGAISG